jgi:uncharacterized membrane protein YccF (DUF307 family)
MNSKVFAIGVILLSTVVALVLVVIGLPLTKAEVEITNLFIEEFREATNRRA